MNTTQKILIEQSLYGITDDSISGENFLNEAINMYIENPNPDYTLVDTLSESINGSDSMSKYITLLEDADDIKKYEEEINKAKDSIENEDDDKKQKNLWQKMLDKANGAVTWWYKIDPESKAKSFRTIATITFTVAEFFIRLYARSKTGGYLKLSKNDKFTLNPVKVAKRINWKGASIDSAIGLAASTIRKLTHEIYYKVNSKDVEEMIDKYDKAIDDLNDMISETDDEELLATLKKAKVKYTEAIRDLIRIRNEKNLRNSDIE